MAEPNDTTTQETSQVTPTQTTEKSTQTSDTTSTGTLTGQPTKFEYAEDRSKWIPPHRLQEETTKRKEFENRFARVEGALAERDRQIAALTGSKLPTEEEAEVDLVRQRLRQIEPWMGKLDDEKVDKLLSLLEQSNALQDSNVKVWRNHANSMLNSVYGSIEKELGGELSARQRQKVYIAYREAAANDPAFLQRHEDGDPKLVEEFAREWIDDWFEPARRKVTQTQVERQRRVPSGGRTTPVTSTKPKIDFKNDDAFADAMVAAAIEEGLTFGR